MMRSDILLIALAAVYSVPMIRLCLFFIPPLDSSILRRINSVPGRFEWLVRPVRDSALLLGLLVIAGKEIYAGRLFPAVWFIGFISVSIFSMVRCRLLMRRMAEFARKNRFIHPATFFECYYSGFGCLPTRLPREKVTTASPLECSFKRGRTKKRLWPVMAGVFNTASIARIVLASFKWKGPEYAREVAQSLCVIWGARVAQLAEIELKVEVIERLAEMEGRFIFVFNHKSYLDFALGTYALSSLHPKDRKRFDFRFLAARDHFLDNRFLYLIMGKAMQVIGTIFVDRAGKRTSPRTAAVEAAEKLANFDLDIVMFPQGTRAYPNISSERNRMDSGYYTSGTRERLKGTGGHIKKGAAFIAVDTAILLRNIERSSVNIIPAGLLGTGLAAPLGHMLIQTGTEITVRIGQPIIIKGSDVKDLSPGLPEYRTFVEDIHRRIDDSLKSLIDIHALLEKRFFRDIRALLPASDYEHVAVAMKAWRGRDYFVFTILDCIYATDPLNWNTLLREISYLLISDAPAGSLQHFKERVVDIMVEGRKP